MVSLMAWSQRRFIRTDTHYRSLKPQCRPMSAHRGGISIECANVPQRPSAFCDGSHCELFLKLRSEFSQRNRAFAPLEVLGYTRDRKKLSRPVKVRIAIVAVPVRDQPNPCPFSRASSDDRL